MPMRLPSASTTLATALTIPVNIHIPRNQYVAAQPDRIQLAQRNCLRQPLDACSSKWTGRVAAADQSRRHIRVHLVDQTLREKRCVDRAATLDQQAEDASFTELIEQRLEGHLAVGSCRKLDDLRCTHAAHTGGCDESVGADDLR